MAYAAWSVAFGEQPSAAKWNILGTNDGDFDTRIAGLKTAMTPYYANSSLAGCGGTYVDCASVSVTAPSTSNIVVYGQIQGKWAGTPAVSAYAESNVDGVQQYEQRLDLYATNVSYSIGVTSQSSHAAGTFTVKLRAKVTGGATDFLGSSMLVWVLPN